MGLNMKRILSNTRLLALAVALLIVSGLSLPFFKVKRIDRDLHNQEVLSLNELCFLFLLLTSLSSDLTATLLEPYSANKGLVLES